MSSREADRSDPSALGALAMALDTLALETRSHSMAGELQRLSRILRDYAIPRLGGDRPIDVVFAGPTGSGKSTLVNSVSGLSATTAGVLRPTTTRPVIVTGRDRVDEYATFGDANGEVVAGDSAALESMTLIDTPDLDSTSTEHRAVAERLIDSADVVVFVMSALRYADMVPWQVLRRAAARGANIVPVLNRVTPGTAGSRVDFRARLRQEGIDDRLIVIPEQRGHAGRIPRAATRPLARRLTDLASEQRLVATDTLDRVLDHVKSRTIGHLDRLKNEIESPLVSLGSEQIDAFDLTTLAAALPDIQPEGAARRQLGRWRRLTTNQLEQRGLEDRVGDALSAIIRSESAIAQMQASDAGRVEEDASQLAKTWLDFVNRVCAESGGRRGVADRAYLARAAAEPGSPRGEDPVFGPDFPVLVDRVERDLRNRMAMALEGSHADNVGLDAARLSQAIEETQTALTALAPAPAPAHA